MNVKNRIYYWQNKNRKYVWIVENVTILKDVNIGDNVILDSGLLIYKDIPDNSVVSLKQEINLKPF